jgi:octaprenyl-diphosphate synthase
MPLSTLSHILTPIAEDLQEVENILSVEITSSHPLMQELSAYICSLRGKRLRPAMVLLAGRCLGETRPDHHRLAAITELLHTATLVHDDIIDEAAVRRQKTTVNHRWDNAIAVIFGDFLFSVAFCHTISFLKKPTQLLLGEAIRDMCEGEMLQLQERNSRRISSEAEYLQMIRFKTASFLSVCCAGGAQLSEASDGETEALARFGHSFGMAFQIVDDCLDLAGQESKMGKSLGTDCSTGKSTLPLIRAYQGVPPQEQRVLRELFWDRTMPDGQKKDRLRRWVQEHRGFEEAREIARGYLLQAKEALSLLPDSPARDGLAELSDYVLAREE